MRYPAPPQKGISAILARYPMKTRKWVQYPPLRYYLERVLRDMGGVSRTGPLRAHPALRNLCYQLVLFTDHSLSNEHVMCFRDQGRQSSLNIKFLDRMSRGRPGRYPGGRPGPTTFTPSLGAQENKVCCADVLDQKARTSMTRGGLRKTLCRITLG